MAQRGLFGLYPEHFIKGFESAYFMGANYVETDVNLTKDKKLIIFHDPYLDYTIDIEEQRIPRQTTRPNGTWVFLFK